MTSIVFVNCSYRNKPLKSRAADGTVFIVFSMKNANYFSSVAPTASTSISRAVNAPAPMAVEQFII